MKRIKEMYTIYYQHTEYYEYFDPYSFFLFHGIYNRQILKYITWYVNKIWVNTTKDHLWNTLYKLYCENQWCNKFLYL